MSIYKILGTPVPTISYCILHQGASTAIGEQYLGTLRDLHASLQRESESITAAYTKHVRDTIARESQVLRGSLSEFLSMPMRSDNASVQRIFSDSCERFQEQAAGTPKLGVTRSYEGKVVAQAFQKAADRKLDAGGKAYLKSLGFATEKGVGEIFESVFVVEGGVNLDLIEHIIRDRLGMYVGTHGRHLELAKGYTFSAYNLVGQWGALSRDQVLAGQTELVVFFVKPAMPYEPFRAGVGEALGQISKEVTVSSLSLWQRKLGLGKGKEFIVRALCDSPQRASDILRRIEQYKEPAFVKKALVDQGSVVLKEILIP